MLQLADCHGVLIGKLFAGAHLLRGPAKGERLNVEGKDYVRAHAGNDVLHVVVQSASNGDTLMTTATPMTMPAL